MDGDGSTALMARDAVILLGSALLFVLLFRRFRLGAVLGYLVAGAIIGPHMLGLVGDPRSKLGIAELGITLLLFLVGLELTPSRLWRLKQDVFGFGLAQVVLSGIALSALVYLATSFSPAAAIALGLPLALSSTAQVLPMLQSAGRLRTPFGERAFSILLFQDLSLVPLITVIAALSRSPDASATPGWLMAVYTVVAISGLVLAGRYLLTPMFRLIGGLGERELFVAAGLFTVLASSAVMEALGLSTALGAFVAGVMLADSPYRHELEADVDPFRSILLGLFFVAVGMMLDLHAIAERPFFVFGMAALLIVTKTGIIFGLARLFGMRWREALSLGLLLSQGGEFGFVLFTRAQDALLVAPEAASLFGAIVTLSMATTPFLMRLGRRFREKPAKGRIDLDGPEMADQARAIIIGYGRFGQTVGQMLTSQRISVTLVDSNPALIDQIATFDMKVYFGDGSRIDLLRHAGAENAQLILFCHDSRALDADTLGTIAEAFPKASIFVRAYDRQQMMNIGSAPVAGAVREVYESAICLARLAMKALEMDDSEITDAEEHYRRIDGDRLAMQTQEGDLRAGAHLMFKSGDPKAEPIA